MPALFFANDLSSIINSAPLQIALTLAVVVVLQLSLRSSIGRIVERVVHAHKYASRTEERKREETLTKVFRTASGIVLWIVAIVVILAQLRVNIAALLTGAGVVSVIVGFGAQSAIKDFLAGIFIIIENQYRVGDIVTLNASGNRVSGVVEDITIRITKLRDMDGNLHIVPNGLAGIITNQSFQFANVNLDVRVSYQADITTVEQVLNRLGAELADDEKWKDNIVEPVHFLRVDSFGDSAVTVKAVGKVRPGTQWDTAGEFRRRLLPALAKAHIEIPLPQVVVHETKR